MSPEQLDKTVTFARGFYSVLAEYVSGDTTVNELRVLTELARTSQKNDEGTSVSDISDATGIPRATVSRLITKWMAMGRRSPKSLRRTPRKELEPIS
jgi:DNA-binding MarR family transcriptional regulator